MYFCSTKQSKFLIPNPIDPHSSWASVFLDRRSKQDLQRNAIVSKFSTKDVNYNLLGTKIGKVSSSGSSSTILAASLPLIFAGRTKL